MYFTTVEVTDLTEVTLDHLSGYHGSKPVRIGNAAYSQEQHDIFGVVMDVIYQDLKLRHRTPEALDRIWTQARSIVRNVAAEWKDPDRGIWEIRGEKRHFVFSKVMAWVALDRAIRMAEELGLAAPVETWRKELDEHQALLDRWAAEWIKIADQYKEARMALESMAAWQKQMEQQWQQYLSRIP